MDLTTFYTELSAFRRNEDPDEIHKNDLKNDAKVWDKVLQMKSCLNIGSFEHSCNFLSGLKSYMDQHEELKKKHGELIQKYSKTNRKNTILNKNIKRFTTIRKAIQEHPDSDFKVIEKDIFFTGDAERMMDIIEENNIHRKREYDYNKKNLDYYKKLKLEQDEKYERDMRVEFHKSSYCQDMIKSEEYMADEMDRLKSQIKSLQETNNLHIRSQEQKRETEEYVKELEDEDRAKELREVQKQKIKDELKKEDKWAESERVKEQKKTISSKDKEIKKLKKKIKDLRSEIGDLQDEVDSHSD